MYMDIMLNDTMHVNCVQLCDCSVLCSFWVDAVLVLAVYAV